MPLFHRDDDKKKGKEDAKKNKTAPPSTPRRDGPSANPAAPKGPAFTNPLHINSPGTPLLVGGQGPPPHGSPPHGSPPHGSPPHGSPPHGPSGGPGSVGSHGSAHSDDDPIKEAEEAVKRAIGEYLEHGIKSGKIGKAYKLKGGWENWLQVELAIFLKEYTEHSVAPLNRDVKITRVEREEWVYEENLKNDLFIEVQVRGTTCWISMEIKCEAAMSDSKFGDRVLDDLKKLNKAHKKPKHGHPMRALGLVVATEKSNIASIAPAFKQWESSLQKYLNTVDQKVKELKMSIWMYSCPVTFK